MALASKQPRGMPHAAVIRTYAPVGDEDRGRRMLQETRAGEVRARMVGEEMRARMAGDEAWVMRRCGIGWQEMRAKMAGDEGLGGRR
eukprot:1148419-Pelagomonas_calceolata.AAC.2